MKTTWIFIFLLLGLLPCCKKETDDEFFVLDKETKLKAGIIYHSPFDNLSVKVIKISDSRCPTGVQCIWQGEATVYLEVNESKKWDVILSTVHQPKDTVNNYSIKLIDVIPYPVYKVDFPDSDKIVVLQIDKL